MFAGSAQIVKYGSTTLAAGALYNDFAVQGKSYCKAIYTAMPAGSEAVIKFLVVTDRIPNAVGEADKAYHAAVLHLEKTLEGKFKVTATIDSYVNGIYQKPALLLQDDSAVSNISDLMVQDSREVLVRRYPVISDGDERAIKGSKNFDGYGVVSLAILVL